MPRLPRSFFQRDPVTCAAELIGCELVWDDCAGVVVETEAYSATGDEACHTFKRPSARDFIARHPTGAAYVYLNYGMYWLLNVLVKGGTADGFVLIRAIEPTIGIESMEQRRATGRKSKVTHRNSLCSGPGKLAIAFGVTHAHHGIDLCGDSTRHFRRNKNRVEIVSDVRVGISLAAHLPWRFLLKDSPFVSVPVKS